MLGSALNAFSDAVSMLLRNTVEKRSVLENLDLVLLCLDETIDDGYETISLCVDICRLNALTRQHHCRDGLYGDCFASEQTKSRYDRNRHQRADSPERLPDCKGENATENRTIVDSGCFMAHF